MTTPERSVEEKWQDKFLNAGTEKGLGDLSMMIGVVGEILEAERQKREEQAKRYITLMNQALGETELPEDVWKKIARVNQLILDK